MKNLLFILVALVCGLSTKLSAADSAQAKPNIIIMLVDDMGVMDTSVPFLTDENGKPKRYPLNEYYRTPNMEQLAKRGIRFNQFCAMSVCSPTRISIMTGQNAARHRTTNWINPDNNNAGPQGAPDWNWQGLKKGDVTLAALLKADGYRTIHVGKGHFGPRNSEGADPKNLGFDINVGGASIGAPASYYGMKNYGNAGGSVKESVKSAVPGLDKYHGTETFLTEALTIEANRHIADAVQDQKPFFLYFPQYAVHGPFNSDPRFAPNYKNSGKPEQAQAFATLIEGMDKSLGDILSQLDKLGVAENTLVFFVGDNGSDAPLGHQHDVACAAPLRGKKGSHYEGGTRVPFIAAWCKSNAANPFQKQLPIPTEAIQSQQAAVFDMFPTILGLVGIDLPKQHAVDGKRLDTLLSGKRDEQRDESFLMHYPHSPHRSEYFTVYREKDWKVIYHYFPTDVSEGSHYQLFHLGTDPFEQTNLANSKPAELRRMMNGLVKSLEQHNAVYPVDKDGQATRPKLPPAEELNSANPDRNEQPGVPQGKISTGVFSDSQIFPGTRRDFSVYVPAQYDANVPANLMVFQDGVGYAKGNGAFRVPIVFDNLIHQKAMPVTIAVFVSPGTIPSTKPGAKDRSNRSFEYDSMGDRYSRFLVEEFLPVALQGLNVSSDPKRRAIAGISSGGICAFTVAWEKPDQFGKVMSHIGSFTNIRGGWAYPGLIRKTKSAPKPIKVYLQEGKDDLNNLFGNWPLANQDLAAALRFAGYETKLDMTEGGHSGNWGGDKLPSALRWLWADQDKEPASEKAAIANAPTQSASKWEPHPDAMVREGVPHGTVEEMGVWESKIFENTTREWAIYVPAQYNKEQPAALMVFQDGHSYRDVKGRWRVPVVFDNLIARGDMPPTIAIFLNPGHEKTKEKPQNPWKGSNRSFEYDSLGDRYAKFLLEEIIPEVEKRYSLSSDPEMRAICGASSGGICSFTVAWERPDAFRKVLSTIGSFTNLRGGNVYPSLIRTTDPKPIRVYLADTSGDLDNPFGNWPWSNQLMASALKYAGYDTRFDWAEGFGHNADHGGAIFPEALKWLWRKEKHTPAFDTKGDLKGDLTLMRLLVPNATWEVVAENLGFADAPCSDSQGNFYFSDMKAPAVYKINNNDGQRIEIVKEAVSGMKFGPDGLLYGCQGAKERVISIDPKSGAIREIASKVAPNDLAVSADGFIYITETKHQRVTRIEIKTGIVTSVDTGINKPNGIALSNDGGTLAVSDSGGEHTWMFRVNSDASLDAKMPTMTMRLAIDPKGDFKFNEPPPYLSASRGDGMAVDKSGRYYVTSAIGIQIFDPTGRQCGVLPKPKESMPLTSCNLAGPDFEYLYVTNGDTVFRRKLNVD